MNWSQPLHLYCERIDPSFWSEPFNAISNAAFFIAAGVALVEWRRAGGRDLPALALIGVVIAIGTGSFLFHTFANRGTYLLDVIPIGVFIYGYLLMALRRFLRLGIALSVAIVIAFAAFATTITVSVPRSALNGSHAYLPALGAVIVMGLLLRRGATGKLMFAAGAALAMSLVVRTVDLAICSALPIGTHFLWHCLNGLVVYLLLRAALTGRQSAA